jgi:hypothetical protein
MQDIEYLQEKWQLSVENASYEEVVAKMSGQGSPKSWVVPLTQESLTPPLVTVFLLHRSASDMDLHNALQSIEQQTYARHEIILIHLQTSDRHSFVQQAFQGKQTQLWIAEQLPADRVFQAAWSLAQGKYFSYLATDKAYPPDHLEVMVRHLYEQRARSGVCRFAGQNVSAEIPTGAIEEDLSFVMHLNPRFSPLDVTFPDYERIRLAGEVPIVLPFTKIGHDKNVGGVV